MHTIVGLRVERPRLAVIPGSARSLVIDRFNGKWAIIGNTQVPYLEMLLRGAGEIPSHARPAVEHIEKLLKSAGLAQVEQVSEYGLNTLILKLTKVCNYRCSYCYDMEPDDHLVHLPYEIAIQSIREALELAQEGLSIIFHGGEPTLFFPLIRRLVIDGERYAAEAGKRISFRGQTNLSRLTEEMVEFFIEHKVGWGISLDGPPQFNDRFRVLPDGSGTYRFFEQALARFPEFVRSCGVLSTVTASNQDHLPEIAAHFRDRGMGSWDWTLFQPIGMGRELTERCGLSYDRVVDSWNRLFDAVLAGEFDGFNLGPIMDYLRNFLGGPGASMCLRHRCGAARDLLSISADGSVEACDCIDRKGPLGNLGLVQIGKSNSLSAAANSEKGAFIRSREVERGECGSCTWLKLCGGTCMAYAPSIHEKSGGECQISMNAFNRIAEAMLDGDQLKRYWKSVG